MNKKIIDNKWRFKQFCLINKTAKLVYDAVQGGIAMNFYACFSEFESGVFGWTKEAHSFQAAILIYEEFTGNDAWDILSELEEIFGDELEKFSFEELVLIEKSLTDED
jgi:hypothetical protein